MFWKIPKIFSQQSNISKIISLGLLIFLFFILKLDPFLQELQMQILVHHY